jgi:hypothetical protein
LIIAIDLKPVKATMRTTPRILDQISAERTKVGERLARLEADRATVTAQLTDLEAAERVLTASAGRPLGERGRLPPQKPRPHCQPRPQTDVTSNRD